MPNQWLLGEWYPRGLIDHQQSYDPVRVNPGQCHHFYFWSFYVISLRFHEAVIFIVGKKRVLTLSTVNLCHMLSIVVTCEWQTIKLLFTVGVFPIHKYFKYPFNFILYLFKLQGLPTDHVYWVQAVFLCHI